MRPQRLRHPVTVTGSGILGLGSEVTFRPTTSPGWMISFLGDRPHAHPFPIDTWALRLGWRNICVNLKYPDSLTGKRTAYVVEHALAAREGLALYDGVCLEIGRHGIPFTGHSQSFVDAITPALEPSEITPRCYTTSRTISMKTADGLGSVEFQPSNSGDLVLEISADYSARGLGADSYTWHSGRNTLADIANARGELKPEYWKIVRTLEMIGWPHGDAFADLGMMDPTSWLSSLLHHRGIDTLGELGAVAPNGKLSGICHIHRAGHREAVPLVRMMTQNLVEVRKFSRVA